MSTKSLYPQSATRSKAISHENRSFLEFPLTRPSSARLFLELPHTRPAYRQNVIYFPPIGSRLCHPLSQKIPRVNYFPNVSYCTPTRRNQNFTSKGNAYRARVQQLRNKTSPRKLIDKSKAIISGNKTIWQCTLTIWKKTTFRLILKHTEMKSALRHMH